jgi:restriction system protein
MYYVEVRHKELGKYRYIKGNDRYVVEQKAASQRQQWNEMWDRKQAIENSKNEKLAKRYGIEQKKEEAKALSEEAALALKELDEILLRTIGVNDAIDWEAIKDRSPFPEAKPVKAKLETVPIHPDKQAFAAKLGLLDKIFKARAEKKALLAEQNYTAAYSKWEKDAARIEAKNQTVHESYAAVIEAWQGRQQLYLEDQAAKHHAIEDLKTKYLNKEPEAITEYCDMVLSRSQYPDYFPQQYDLEYRLDNKTLIIEYVLPHISILPTLKDVNYIQSKDTFKESSLTETQLNKAFDKVLYDITLRSIHEVFEADTANAIDAVVFNGWVHFVSPATGKEVNSCILSIHTTKTEFMEINLERVESKTCFKNLKGVGSSKLHSLTPIAPVMQMDKSDKRFIESYDVEQSLDESTNLAMMDWQDFEHLVREIFEKEFSSAGGEVKVTQSSRDGGVDAVIFDPDPIRGGKIVVQAKRYANTVGVANVRDLYGTVMNEGANKGILITTSDYGPDAYTFAKDKPITLLNGGHLLHLLSKHGHKARIDLGEAKKKASA